MNRLLTLITLTSLLSAVATAIQAPRLVNERRSTGARAVSYRVNVNNGLPRTGTLTLAGQAFVRAQDAEGCTYSFIRPGAQNFSPGGGHGMLSLLTGPDCSWTASSSVPWITILNGGTGTGDGRIDFDVAANMGTSRTGTINVAGQSFFTVNQSTAAPRNATTVGVFRPANGSVYLKNTNTGGFDDLNFSYGNPGDKPLAGDWNGDGSDTIGSYRCCAPDSQFYIRNLNTTGDADRAFPFGTTGDLPLVGDWNGDGFTTVGVYRPSTRVFFLSNYNENGLGDIVFQLANTNTDDVPIASDWDGDGITTVGIFRPANATFLLRNSNTSGGADMSFVYGNAGDLPVVGDWDGDGIDTIGVYRNGVFYLRNSNSAGAADLVFAFGADGDVPIAGDWDGLP